MNLIYNFFSNGNNDNNEIDNQQPKFYLNRIGKFVKGITVPYDTFQWFGKTDPSELLEIESKKCKDWINNLTDIDLENVESLKKNNNRYILQFRYKYKNIDLMGKKIVTSLQIKDNSFINRIKYDLDINRKIDYLKYIDPDYSDCEVYEELNNEEYTKDINTFLICNNEIKVTDFLAVLNDGCLLPETCYLEITKDKKTSKLNFNDMISIYYL